MLRIKMFYGTASRVEEDINRWSTNCNPYVVDKVMHVSVHDHVTIAIWHDGQAQPEGPTRRQTLASEEVGRKLRDTYRRLFGGRDGEA